MASDPVSRLQLAQAEVDRVFGSGYAQDHPEIVAVVVQSAASDYAALAIARAMQDIAAALAIEDEPLGGNGAGLVRAPGLIARL
jgi:hypothetical protein